MADRIRTMRQVFNYLIDVGLPGPGVRHLDHGVCSGLLQILASTYYYRIHSAIEVMPAPISDDLERWHKKYGWDPRYWWVGVVWATAAAAVHNIQQMDGLEEIAPGLPRRMRISDDPLAYLGVLVDLIEEWDRYSVFKLPLKSPVQSSDVLLGHSGDRVVVRFTGRGASRFVPELKRKLDEVLANWRSFVVIRT